MPPTLNLTQLWSAPEESATRWSRQGKGKSGGVRVIYYYWTADNEVYMLYLYAKNEQADLDAAGRKAAKKFVEELKHAKEKHGKDRQ